MGRLTFKRGCESALWLGASLSGLLVASGADADEVRAVRVSGTSESAEIVVGGGFGIPTYSVRSRNEGRVVVLEVTGASLLQGGVSPQGQASLVRGVSTSRSAQGVRIEVELDESVAYRARAEDGRLVLTVESLDQATTPPAPAVAETAGPTTLRDLHIERRDGRDRVVLEVQGHGEFRVVPGTTGPARLELTGAQLGSSVERLLTGDRQGSIHEVRVRESGGRVVVEADRADGCTTMAVRDGDRIVWLFAPTETPNRPRTRTIARESSDEGVQAEDDMTVTAGDVAGFLTDLPMQTETAQGSRRYTGRRIELDFKDADIHNILRLLAEFGGVNVVTSDDVSGSVTIRMRNVPWDQALDVILQAKSLGMVRRGNLIRVAPLATLEKEREAAIARRKQQEQLAPLETRLVPVSYATATSLQPRVNELLSSRGTVSVDERTNTLIVRDITDQLDDVEELVRTLDTQTPQVLIEARIVEATSQYSRDVGIQWGFDSTMGTATGNPTGLIFPSGISINGGDSTGSPTTGGLSPFGSVAQPNYAVNLPATTAEGQGGALGMSFGSIAGNFNLNVRLSAAEATGTVRIISSPRILTLDNHEATISQGTMIPYSQVSAQGVQTAFQEAKLSLQVRPHVTSDGSVAMEVKVERSEPDFNRTSSRGDPAILKREAETNLLVADGNTAVIGGIYTRSTGRNVDQVPFFGDIPILGVLFQRRRVRDDRNELLIFLTPRIVNRSEALQNPEIEPSDP